MTAMIIDVVVVAILLISTVIAVLRGFVREVLTILGLIGSIVITWFTGGILAGFYNKHLTSWAAAKLDKPVSDKITHLPIWKFDLPIDLLATVASYGSIFVVAFIALALLNMYVSSLVQESELSTLDRSLGALFGLVRGLVLVVLLYMPITLFIGEDGEKPEWLQASKSVPLLEYTVDFVKTNVLPSGEKLIEKVADNKEKVSDEKLSEKIVDKAQSLKEKIINNTTDKDKKGYRGKDRESLQELIEEEIDGTGFNQ